MDRICDHHEIDGLYIKSNIESKWLKMMDVGNQNCIKGVSFTNVSFTPYVKSTFNTLDTVCIPVFSGRPNNKQGVIGYRDE